VFVWTYRVMTALHRGTMSEKQERERVWRVLRDPLFYALARGELTHEQLAQMLGVRVRSIRNYFGTDGVVPTSESLTIINNWLEATCPSPIK
jgi:hypothetical protein